MILNQNTKELRVLVKVTDLRRIARVSFLLKKNRVREAFKYLLAKAEVENHIPRGTRPKVRPDVVLFEDMCS